MLINLTNFFSIKRQKITHLTFFVASANDSSTKYCGWYSSIGYGVSPVSSGAKSW